MGGAETVFWLSAAALAYTWAGYPLLLAAWGRRPGRVLPRDYAQALPTVSVLIAAYNEEHTIARKLRNCLRQCYPAELLEIVVAADGCSDATEQVVCSFGARVRLVSFPQRRGKMAAINDALPRCRGEIVVLTDAEEVFDRGAVGALVAGFASGVGAVSGVVRFSHPASAVGAGAGVYWRLERYLRERESRIYSLLGASGCIYALRRMLFRPQPPDSLSDDAAIPLDLVSRGWRVVHQPAAIAYSRREGEPGQEFRRKARTTAGTWQLLWRQRRLLLPGSKVAVQIFSHYLMRLACPLFLLGALAGAAAGRGRSPWLAAALAGQVAFYLAALLGGRWQGRPVRGVLLLPYYFCLAYLADIVGLVHLVAGRQRAAWQRS